MYEAYWQLQSNPFDSLPDSRFFYHSETHQAALLKLNYLVEHRKGAAILVGASGSGKSFVTQVLAEQLPDGAGPLISVLFPQMSSSELLAYLAAELGGETEIMPEVPSVDRTIRQLQELFATYARRGQHPVIVIEEAHLIDDPQVFMALRLLLNFQPQHGGCFSLILAGQRELLTRIHRLPQLEERIAVKCLLRPLTYEETLGYIAQRIRMAGGQQELFESDALEALFELSSGLPRRLNRLCDLALLVGFADSSSIISSEQVEAVAEELAAVVPE